MPLQPAPPGYAWDPRLQGGRYRVVLPDGRLGRIVTPTSIANDLRALHERSANQYARLVAGVYNGQITPAVFQLAMQAELKNIHTAMAALGVGGWSRADQATWGRVGQELRTEYRYLAGFVREIAEGNLTEAQARERAKLYADNAYGRFWDEYTRTLKANGMTRERIVTANDERVCKICGGAEDRGWVPIGTWSLGLHNRCRCRKDYE